MWDIVSPLVCGLMKERCGWDDVDCVYGVPGDGIHLIHQCPPCLGDGGGNGQPSGMWVHVGEEVMTRWIRGMLFSLSHTVPMSGGQWEIWRILSAQWYVDSFRGCGG